MKFLNFLFQECPPYMSNLGFQKQLWSHYSVNLVFATLVWEKIDKLLIYLLMTDYSQYAGQNQAQQYKQPQVVQQQVQTASPRKPSVQFSPPPPQPSYNTVQQDVYSQSQDYSDNYSLQVLLPHSL